MTDADGLGAQRLVTSRRLWAIAFGVAEVAHVLSFAWAKPVRQVVALSLTRSPVAKRVSSGSADTFTVPLAGATSRPYPTLPTSLIAPAAGASMRLQAQAVFRGSASSTSPSTMTGAFITSSAAPITARGQIAASSPKSAIIKSVKPSMTSAWRTNPGARSSPCRRRGSRLTMRSRSPILALQVAQDGQARGLRRLVALLNREVCADLAGACRERPALRGSRTVPRDDRAGPDDTDLPPADPQVRRKPHLGREPASARMACKLPLHASMLSPWPWAGVRLA